MKAVILATLALASGAAAQERDYCPSRPGLGTPACTIDPGKVSVETAVADWERDDQGDTRMDTVLVGDTIVRVGLGATTEAIVGWTPYGHVRERDEATGAIDRFSRVGDVTLGLKANLASPDGSGLSFAVLPYVTLPTGRMPVGAGDWGAGVLAPLTYDLTDSVNLQFTPEVDAAVNEDGDGRHFAVSGIAGIDVKLSKALDVTAEIETLRDEDPSGSTTQAFAALSLAWLAKDDLQLDLGAVAGLNHDTPDARLYAGVSRRF